jgi:hypothetical protein
MGHVSRLRQKMATGLPDGVHEKKSGWWGSDYIVQRFRYWCPKCNRTGQGHIDGAESAEVVLARIDLAHRDGNLCQSRPELPLEKKDAERPWLTWAGDIVMDDPFIPMNVNQEWPPPLKIRSAGGPKR